MSKIYVRERRQAAEGSGQPRFRIVAATGADLRVYVPHLRRAELEQIAAGVNAEIVYLPRGEHEHAHEHDHEGRANGGGQRHRHMAGTDTD